MGAEPCTASNTGSPAKGNSSTCTAEVPRPPLRNAAKPAPLSKAAKEFYDKRREYLEKSFNPFIKRLQELEKFQASLSPEQRANLFPLQDTYQTASADFATANKAAQELRIQAESEPSRSYADEIYWQAGKILTDVAEKYRPLLRVPLRVQIGNIIPDSGTTKAQTAFDKSLELFESKTKSTIQSNYLVLKSIDLNEAAQRDPIHRQGLENLLAYYESVNSEISRISTDVVKKYQVAAKFGDTAQAVAAWNQANQLLTEANKNYNGLVSENLNLQLANVERPIFTERLNYDRYALRMAKDAGWKIEILKDYNTEKNGSGVSSSSDTRVNIDPYQLKGALTFRDPVSVLRFSKQEKVVVKLNSVQQIESINGTPITYADKEVKEYYTYSKISGRENIQHKGFIIPAPKNGEMTVTAFLELEAKSNIFDSSNRVVSLPYDLSPLGPEFRGKTIETTFRQITISPTKKVEPYDLYVSGLSMEQIVPYERKISAFRDGIRAAEKYFGKNSGSIVKTIHLINTDDDQAYQSGQNICVITDERLKLSERDIWLTGFHEAAHAIDEKYKISAELRKLYGEISKISPDTFKLINEKQFITGASGGHSEANERELFASIMVSLVNDDWKGKVRQMDVAHRFNYNLALRKIEEVMGQKNIEFDSQVRTSLRDKITFIDALPQPKV